MISVSICHRHSGALKTALFCRSLLVLTPCEPRIATNTEILPPTVPYIGKWKASVSTDAMTDKQKTFITLQADDSDVSLKLFCDGKDEALFNLNEFPGVEDWAPTDVTQRIGEGKLTEEGRYADPKTGTFDTTGQTEAFKVNRLEYNPFIRDVLRDEDVQRVLKEKAAKAAASQSGAAQ